MPRPGKPELFKSLQLDLVNDVNARRAAAAYAESVEFANPELAQQIRASVAHFGGTGEGGGDGIGAAVRG